MYCLTLQSGLSGKVRVYLRNFIYTYTVWALFLSPARRHSKKDFSFLPVWCDDSQQCLRAWMMRHAKYFLFFSFFFFFGREGGVMGLKS